MADLCIYCMCVLPTSHSTQHQNIHGNTALHMAARGGHLDVCKHLVGHPLGERLVEVANNDGDTADMCVSSSVFPKTYEWMRRAHDDPLVREEVRVVSVKGATESLSLSLSLSLSVCVCLHTHLLCRLLVSSKRMLHARSGTALPVCNMRAPSTSGPVTRCRSGCPVLRRRTICPWDVAVIVCAAVMVMP